MELQGGRIDPMGPVYLHENTYVRHIRPEEAPAVKEMFSSGLIAELVERGFCPEFFQDEMDAEFPDHITGTFVVKSPAVKPAIHDGECSFSMVKEAALTFLEIALIADRYGFTLRDAHMGNFIFTGIRPLWVDLGSFCKKEENAPNPWIWDFFRCLLLPLMMWPMQLSIMAPMRPRRLLKKYLHASLFSCCNNSRFAYVTVNFAARLLGIDNYKGNGKLHRIAKAILKKNTQKRVAWFQRKIHPLEYHGETAWKSYHDGFVVDGKIRDNLSERFNRILSLLKETNPQSVLELAGNAGVFSEIIARQMPQVQVICTDYDTCAVDSLFTRQKKHPTSNLSFGVLDFIQSNTTSQASSPCRRFQSDCVLALAVTHHLTLSQGYTLDEVFFAIKNYSSRIVFIEFMPLGLYVNDDSPRPPEWYTEELFRSSFEKFFTVNHVETLEKNRILYCGTVIPE